MCFWPQGQWRLCPWTAFVPQRHFVPARAAIWRSVTSHSRLTIVIGQCRRDSARSNAAAGKASERLAGERSQPKHDRAPAPSGSAKQSAGLTYDDNKPHRARTWPVGCYEGLRGQGGLRESHFEQHLLESGFGDDLQAAPTPTCSASMFGRHTMGRQASCASRMVKQLGDSQEDLGRRARLTDHGEGVRLLMAWPHCTRHFLTFCVCAF